MKSLRLQLLLTLLLCNVSCGNPFQTKGLPEDTVFEAGAVTFGQVQKAVLTPQCIRCHSDYLDGRNVIAALPRIINRIESGSMPPGGPRLSSNQIELVKDWALSQTNNARPLAPNWNSIRAQLIGPKCVVCHNPNGQALFLDLSTREAVEEARDRIYGDGQKLIDLDNPLNSYILSIVQDPVEPMPPAPPFSDIDRLNENEIEILTEWIKRGLP